MVDQKKIDELPHESIFDGKWHFNTIWIVFNYYYYSFVWLWQAHVMTLVI